MAASLLPNDKLETETFAPDNSSVKIGENVIVERGARPVASFCAAIQYGAEVAAQESGAVLSNSQGERLIGFLHIPGDSLTYQSRSNNQFVDKCLQNIESMEQPAKDRLAALISSYCANRGIAQPGSADTDRTLDRHKDNRQVIGLAIKGYFDEAVTASKDRDIHILLGGFEGAFGSGVTRVVNNPSGDFVKNDENIIKSVSDAFEGKASVLNSQASGVISFQIVSDLGSPVRLTIHQKLFTTSSETVSPGSAGSIFHAVKDTSPDAILLTGVGTYTRGSSGPSCYVAETVIRPNLLTAPDQEERLYKSDFLHNESLLRVLKKGE